MPLCLFPSTLLFPSIELFLYCTPLIAIEFSLTVDATPIDISLE